MALPWSYYRSTRNWLLSYLLPIRLALALDHMANRKPSIEQGVFKFFVQELEEGLIIKVGSSRFISKLISYYLEERFLSSMYTGEVLEFSEQMKFYLSQAYESDLDDKEKQNYKQLAFFENY